MSRYLQSDNNYELTFFEHLLYAVQYLGALYLILIPILTLLIDEKRFKEIK